MRSARAQYLRYRMRHTVLSIAHERVLRTLSYGGMLTEAQIRGAARLTTWRTRQTLADLVQRGLIASGARPGRFEITCTGRKALAGKTSGATFHEGR